MKSSQGLGLFLGLVWMLGGCQPAVEQGLINKDEYQLSKGLILEVVAAEPWIQAPVAMGIDLQGRWWVLEMPGYMSDIDGLGEEEPTGRIVILTDKDKDGKADLAKVFLDSLVLARAICLAYGGLLYAEPPNLWFMEIEEGDKPGKKTLVDSLYSTHGNVEHLPNSLCLNLDNWIYSAKSNVRYRKRGEKWIKENTALRGQWGMSHDDEGKLYYNNNSTLLLRDEVLPQAALQNPFLRKISAVNQLVQAEKRLKPLHANWVNRGYMEGVLAEDGRLKETSSACGPLIYRGNGLSSEFVGDGFVCVPEANMIKRISKASDGGSLEKEVGKAEFLASTDPFFRPVNLYNGHDGAIYVVDMHRGVIQHQAYMSPYLREKILESQMDTVIHQGRILAIRSKSPSAIQSPSLEQASISELIEALKHPNGWVRDKAQHEIVYRQLKSGIPALKKLVEGPFPANLHAFWTLEGLSAIDSSLFALALSHAHPALLSAAIYLRATDPNLQNIPLSKDMFQELWEREDPEIAPYLALILPQIELGEALYERMWELLNRRPDNPGMISLVLSGMKEKEKEWLQYLEGRQDSGKPSWTKASQEVWEARQNGKPNPELTHSLSHSDDRTEGLLLYRQYCSSCHGINGMGQEKLAPSLMGSKFIGGDARKLGLVLLYGLRGPLHRDGETYEYPLQMPGLASNASLDDEKLAQIIAYVRNAFSKSWTVIRPSMVDSLRGIEMAANQGLTEERLFELLEK